MSNPQIADRPMGQKIAYNTVIQFAGRIVGAVLAIISTRLIADALGVAEYGRYATIFAYITFFGAFADFGFFWYLVREVAKSPASTEKITANVITLRLLFSLGVLILGSLIAWLIPNYDNEVKLGIILLAGSMLWVTLSNTLIGIFQANNRMDYPVINEIIGRVTTLILTVLVLKAGLGLLPIVLAALSGSFIIFALNAIMVRRYTRLRLGFDRQLWRSIMRENLSLGINVLLGIIYFKIDSVILSALRPSLDIGIYAAAYKIIEILLAFPAMFMGAIFPSLAPLLIDNPTKAKQLMQVAFDALLIAGIGVWFGAAALAPEIIELTTKGRGGFLTASAISINGLAITAPVILQFLLVAVFLAFLGNFYVSVIVAAGAQQRLIKANIINAIVNSLGNFLLIPLFSYVAAASFTIISELIMLISAASIVRGQIGFRPSWQIAPKVILTGLAMAVVINFTKSGGLAVAVICGSLAFLTLNWLVGSLEPELIRRLLNRKGS